MTDQTPPTALVRHWHATDMDDLPEGAYYEASAVDTYVSQLKAALAKAKASESIVHKAHERLVNENKRLRSDNFELFLRLKDAVEAINELRAALSAELGGGAGTAARDRSRL